MTTEELPPLPDDIRKALQEEAARLPPPPAALAPVMDRIASSLGGSVLPASSAALGVKKVALIFALGAGLGGVGGAALHARWAAPEPLPPEPPRAAIAPPSAPPPPAAPVLAEPEPPAPAPKAAVRQEPRGPSAGERERLLIERAGVALARGDAAGALEACRDHERHFPQGQLEEERESLAVRALVAKGDFAAAKARGLRFHRAFPNSLLGPVVDEVLAWVDGGVTDLK